MQFATTEHIDLTIIGLEAPLVTGITDTFQSAELACFGPSQAAQQQAYHQVDQIRTDALFCRRDIGYRALNS